MQNFMVNGYPWNIKFVEPYSPMLMDRTGKYTKATTDPISLTIYICRGLDPYMLKKVLIHELGHCYIFSYGLIDDIHKAVKPEYWLEAEEWICNFIANYGPYIFDNYVEIENHQIGR